MLKSFIRFLVPFGLVELYRKRLDANRFIVGRKGLSNSLYSHSRAIDYLVSIGIPSHDVVAGSMPHSSLNLIDNLILEYTKKSLDRKCNILHVGNFVGISLSSVVNSLSKSGVSYQVIAIDPNIEHRNVKNPQNVVCRLLDQFGLTENVLLCCGYTLSKTLGDDGFHLSNGASPSVRSVSEAAPTNVLKTLRQNFTGLIDVALIDGNHDGDYLKTEIAEIKQLLKPSGILILDDVNEDWPEVSGVAHGLDKDGWEITVADNRIAVLKRREIG